MHNYKSVFILQVSQGIHEGLERFALQKENRTRKKTMAGNVSGIDTYLGNYIL